MADLTEAIITIATFFGIALIMVIAEFIYGLFEEFF